MRKWIHRHLRFASSSLQFPSRRQTPVYALRLVPPTSLAIHHLARGNVHLDTRYEARVDGLATTPREVAGETSSRGELAYHK